MALTAQALDHLVVNVSDVETSAGWYARVLGMTRTDVATADGKPARTEMRFGRQKINLRPIAASKADWFTADHEAAGSDDLCFLTDSAPAEVVRHLEVEGVVVVEEWPAHRHAKRDEINWALDRCRGETLEMFADAHALIPFAPVGPGR